MKHRRARGSIGVSWFTYCESWVELEQKLTKYLQFSLMTGDKLTSGYANDFNIMQILAQLYTVCPNRMLLNAANTISGLTSLVLYG